MKQCRECGTLSPDDTVFCYICGTRFPENDAEEKSVDSESSDLVNNNESLISDSTHVYEANQSALRTNGVYYFIEGGFRYLLKFSSDGAVLGTSDINTSIPIAASVSGITYRDQGRYSIENGQISFSLINQQGQVDYWGQVLNNELLLNLHSHLNGHRASNERYQFVEM